MKRIITSIITVLGIATCFNQSYANDKLNSKEYISVLNKNIAISQSDINKEEIGTFDMVFKGLEKGYIQTALDNETELRESISNTLHDIGKLNVSGSELQKKNDQLVEELNDLVLALDKSIECKRDILNSDTNGLVKFKRVLFENDKLVNEANSKIETINSIYKDINSYR